MYINDGFSVIIYYIDSINTNKDFPNIFNEFELSDLKFSHEQG